MTEKEFADQYERLKDVHPGLYKSHEKMKTIWEHVKDLPGDWFRQRVDNVVMSNNPYEEKYDIGYAAAAERRAMKSAEFAESVSKALDATKAKITEQGLDNALEKYGAKSIWGAIDKSRRGEVS